ncbi:MAG: collagen-like protein [Synechocystis sp.]|nr:collagen-like protein [Synechocystis sp.]
MTVRSIFLASLFLPGFAFSFPVNAAPLSADCLLLAQASQATAVGQTPPTGTPGKNGRDGADTDGLTIFSDGSAMTLNLAGKPGEAGQAGGEAAASDCPPVETNRRENVRMADGGTGGDGGNGGNGGNGGSITIYSRNVNNLSQIFVNAAGGKGGQPGSGGAGSAGCDCPQPYWTVETCSGRPGSDNYRCSTQEFRCYDGRDGTPGRSGVAGQGGLPGKLTVLNLDRPLEDDRPAAAVPLSTLKNQGFTLSKNRWETRTGAAQVLAPGSVVADEYLVLLERIEQSFLLLWNAPQPFERFANTNASLSLNDSQQGIDLELPDDLWLEGTTQQRNNVTEFIVYNALWEGDAKRLGDVTLSGNGRNLKLFLSDEANQSNLMATKFRLQYRVTSEDPRFRPPSTYSTKFDGPVPDNLVTVNGNQFMINIGELAIPEKDLQAGTGVEIELYADRTFSGYNAEQRLTVRDVIKGGVSLPALPDRPAPVTPTNTFGEPPAPVPPPDADFQEVPAVPDFPPPDPGANNLF